MYPSSHNFVNFSSYSPCVFSAVSDKTSEYEITMGRKV